jgi:hypothetical protein
MVNDLFFDRRKTPVDILTPCPHARKYLIVSAVDNYSPRNYVMIG